MNIMISQPMRGKSTDQIKAERAEVEAALKAKGHHVEDSIFTTMPDTKNNPLWCLGAAFKIIATCDAVYFMDGWEDARGCRMEMEACKQYGVPIILQGV